ncbi:MAG: hypothetical protein FWH03_06445 [Firmicutes bacterium]|nr:hypothetical protein [Bacillota bacterium]
MEKEIKKYKLSHFQRFMVVLAFLIIVNSISMIAYFQFYGMVGALISIIFLCMLSCAVFYFVLGGILFYRHKNNKSVSKIGVVVLWIFVWLLLGTWCAFRGYCYPSAILVRPKSLEIFMSVMCVIDFSLALIGMVAVIVQVVKTCKRTKSMLDNP